MVGKELGQKEVLARWLRPFPWLQSAATDVCINGRAGRSAP
jgi:hypothetical protein